MDRDPRRGTFNITDHFGYQRVQPIPQEVHNTNQGNDTHNVHTTKQVPALTDSQVLGVENDQPRNVSNCHVNSSSMANALFHTNRHSRILSFVAAPKAQPMHPTFHSSVHSSQKVREDHPYVMVMYTNFSIVPDYDALRVQAAPRTLYSMGFPPPTSSIADIGAVSAGIGAVTSVMGGADSQFSARQVARPEPSGSSVFQNHLTPSHPSIASACSRPVDQRTVPICSTVPAAIPGRYKMIPPTYQGPLDPATFRDTALRHGIPLQSCPRQELPLQSQNICELRNVVSDRDTTHEENQRRQLQHQFHLQQIHQIQQYQSAQVSHQKMDKQEDMQLSEQVNYSHRQAVHHQQAATSNVRPIISQQPEAYRKSTKTAVTAVVGPERSMAKRQDRGWSGAGYKTDSVPATPITAATSSTIPFSTAPSSPENNGSSSNGSAQREHACQHPGCTKTFDRRYNLTVHFRRHTDEMPYPCKVEGCPERFKWRSSQSHHMKTRHQMFAGKGAKLNVAKTSSKRTATSRVGNKSQSNGPASGLAYHQPLRVSDGQVKLSSQQGTGSRGMEPLSASPGMEDSNYPSNKKAKTEG